jgi:hypothetical protein
MVIGLFSFGSANCAPQADYSARATHAPFRREQLV